MPADVFRAPKGTHDILPPESARWQELERRFADRAARFGYARVVTPLFEHVEVFTRIGESTDIVGKEMYEFADKGGRRLALRPEGTASVVRAFVQHHPLAPWRVWYVAPNFRYERAQRGRYRQHWQLGVEVLGVDDPDLDVEVIDLADGFYRELGLRDVRLLVNSMGDAESRARYVAVLREHLDAHADVLGTEFAGRVATNPLRVLDAKNPEWQEVVEHAPQLFDHLTPDARERFERVQRGLDAVGIPYEISARLVRGFDYYTGTVFEFQSDALDAAQNAVGGGGRYDGLVEQMGGAATPGIGFGIGVERVLIACDAESVLDAATLRDPIDVFVVTPGEGLEATVLLHELRTGGARAEKAYGGRSEKVQFKLAAQGHARLTVVLDRGTGPVTVRERRTGDEHEVGRERLVPWLLERLAEETYTS